MAALAGTEGVIPLLIALAIQQALAPPAITAPYVRPADLPALVTAGIKGCVVVQLSLEAHPDFQPPSFSREVEALDGSRALSRFDRGFCQITSPEWPAKGDVMAEAVQAGLGDLPTPVVIAQWRQPVANERGASVWTTFERKDADGRTIAVVRLIEPADGETGEVDIAWETPPP